MLRRRLAVLLIFLLAIAGVSGVLYAQLESGDRGIPPIDSSGTLEVTGIHVDVGAADPQSARYTGWRIAQRLGFKALYAKMHNVPMNQAPNLPDPTLDDIVSSITVEREQIGPNRYIADLGILFDRARAAQYLGVEGGEVQRSVPMLLIPVIVTGGTATSVELRNSWQRAWAQFRTSQSSIDYVRVSGQGVDPMLVNAAQTTRPGRGWWSARARRAGTRTCCCGGGSSSARRGLLGARPASRGRAPACSAGGARTNFEGPGPSTGPLASLPRQDLPEVPPGPHPEVLTPCRQAGWGEGCTGGEFFFRLSKRADRAALGKPLPCPDRVTR